MKIKKICLQCGKELQKDKYIDGKRRRSSYCSQECKKKRFKEEKTCLYCGRKYWVLLSELKRNRHKEFCSKICKLNYHAETKIRKFNNRAKIKFIKKVGYCSEIKCLNCEKLFIAKMVDLCRERAKYCSQSCCSIHTFKNPENIKNMKIQTRERWKKDEFLFKFYKGHMLGSGGKPTELDKKAIEAKILIHKIRRSLNDRQEAERTS